MWAESSGVAVGVALTGFGMVVLTYLAYGAYLRRGELLTNLPATTSWLPRSMLVAVLASAAWGAAGLADVLSSKLLAWHLSVVFDHIRYAAWSAFLLLLLQPVAIDKASWWWRLRVAGPLTLLLAGAAANLVLALPGPASQSALQAMAAVQLAWAVSGLVLVEQVFRNQGESSRWAAKPLCLGLACLFVYDLYLYAQGLMFGLADPDVVHARPLVHAAAVPLLLVASRRNGRWLASVQVSKTVAFYSASLLLVGAYLLFVAAAGYYVKFFGGTWGGALQVALMATAVLMLAGLMLSAAQRARVRVFLNKHFFRYRYDYRVEWLRFTAMLSSRATPQEVNLQVVRGLADLVESTSGSLWFKSLGDSEYVQSACWNMLRVTGAEPTDSAFSRRMRESEWIVDFTAPVSGSPLQMPSWLAAAGPTWLAIPLLVGNEMPGFVLLGPPRTAIELNWEVRDLLKTAARQAAGFLALMHATEALIETRKFDAFNRMSAFVVHDLKNIITQLSLMLKNAERHRANPEFQQDMLMTVANSLEKMKQMMLQLREGERPEGVSSGVELAPLLSRLQAGSQRRGRELELDVVERLSTRGHENRLERVIGHIVQNALDATPASGKVWIRLQRVAGRAGVVVGDTGAGMTQDFVNTRLFRPFNSTKSHGMGIGSYESLQYLKELGGGIEVQSEVGRGTVVTLLLPLFDHSPESELLGAHGAI